MRDEAKAGRGLTAEERIDAALRAVADATPEAGLQGRILHRLAAERVAMEEMPAGMAGWLQRMPRFAGAAMIAVFVCAAGTAIVVGSVDHARGAHHSPVVAPPVPGLPGSGIGAASAVHPAAPAAVPVPATRASRGRSARTASHGRARIQRHAHKPAGVAVPSPEGNTPQ